MNKRNASLSQRRPLVSNASRDRGLFRIRSLDVILPTTSGVEIRKRCVTQKLMLQLIGRPVGRDYLFNDKDEARAYFTRLIGLIRNMNYTDSESQDYLTRIENLHLTHKSEHFAIASEINQ